MIKGVLFDKDGTLIEFEKTWHRIFRNIFRSLEEEHGLSKEKIARIKEVSGFMEDSFEKESLIQYATVNQIVSRWETEIEEPGFTKARLKSIMEKKSKEGTIEIIPMPGAVHTVKTLYKEGYFLGIATADSKESTMDNLSRMGIEGCFHFIGSDDGIFKGKPDPHMGEEFCKIHGLDPTEVLYVGDSITDMEFAENCGFQFVGVMGENNSWEEFSKRGYKTIGKLGEVMEIIGQDFDGKK